MGVGNQVWLIIVFNIYLDWVNVMIYDYYGLWELIIIGEYIVLYDFNFDVDIDYGINNWLLVGM